VSTTRAAVCRWPVPLLAGLGLALALASAYSAGAKANEPPPSTATPEVLATRFLHALALGDWHGAAALYDPGSSRALKATLWPLLSREVNCGAKAFPELVLGRGARLERYAVDDPTPFAAVLLQRLFGRAAKRGLSLGEGTVVGTVREKPDLTHVLVRTEVGTARYRVARMLVLTFRKIPNSLAGKRQWGLEVSTEVRSFAYRLAQSYHSECRDR